LTPLRDMTDEQFERHALELLQRADLTPRGVCQCLTDVLFLKVRIRVNNLGIGMSRGHETYDRPDGHTHSAKARFASHNFGIAGDAVEAGHVRLYCKTIPSARSAAQTPRYCASSKIENPLRSEFA
jgi:hypothetical protein